VTDPSPDKTTNGAAEFKVLREVRKPARRHHNVPHLPRGHWTAEQKTKATRSRIANGLGFLPNIDARSSTARRYKDIAGAILRDLGGIEQCSQTTIEVVRRFAAIAVLAEQMESRLVNGEAVNSAEFCLLASTLTRLSNKIGLRRIPKAVASLTLQDYFDREQPSADDAEAG
jgi:hypothetical protein